REVSHFVAEIANLVPNKHQPYVGNSAFAHKGGMHIDAVRKNPMTYEHIRPEAVGNRQRMLISDYAGKSSLSAKAEEFHIKLPKKDPKAQELLATLKDLEEFDPQLREMKLLDYKVRVLAANKGTASRVRVLIESGDHKEKWGTVGVSENIMEASWQALADSIEYKMVKDRRSAKHTST